MVGTVNKNITYEKQTYVRTHVIILLIILYIG